MPHTPPSATPSEKRPENIEEAQMPYSAVVDELNLSEKPKRSADSKRRSRPTSTRLNAPQHIDMPASTDSIQPLTAPSEKRNSDGLPIKPEPLYIRRSLNDCDPEKQDYYNQAALTPGFTPTHRPATSPSQPSTTTTEGWNCEFVPSPRKPASEDHLGLILIHLSLLSPLVAGLLSMYSIATAAFLSLLAPLSLCTSRQPFQRSFISSVSPAVRIQLRLIFADDISPNVESVSHLACSAILAPFYAIIIAFAAWVAATFWCYAAILGEPNERAGEEQDGRAAIRAVRMLWENWLLWGLE